MRPSNEKAAPTPAKVDAADVSGGNQDRTTVTPAVDDRKLEAPTRCRGRRPGDSW